jgi:hypothetical protein
MRKIHVYDSALILKMNVLRVEEINKINLEIQSIIPSVMKELPTPSKYDV